MKDFASRRRSAKRIATWLGTTSCLAIASANPAAAQVAAEEVLVTGSLIRGTEAVGVPVTSLGEADFRTSGAVTISDLLKTQPSVFVFPSTSYQAGAANSSRAARINIHNLGPLRTLLLVNGMRVPAGNWDATAYDPSIIPQLAVDRVDVLADGASATYGSDAVAGVVNLILRRGYEGAMTKLYYSYPTEGYGAKAQFSQLYGSRWDTGDVTVSYEWYDEKEMDGDDRTDLYTLDFTPWGLNNITPIRSTLPGIVTVGANPSATTGTTCSNCFSIPKGQNGVGLTWAAIQGNPGVKNQINTYKYSYPLPPQQRNAATITFDQEVTDEIEVFVDGFYSNRRVQSVQPVGLSRFNPHLFTQAIPTTNPYYPIGAPAGIRVSYSLAKEMTPVVSTYEVSARYAGGVNLDLPYEWNGRLFYARNLEKNRNDWRNLVHVNHLNAAVGNTVASVAASAVYPASSAFSKPANIPYLNLFCDPEAFACNSEATLNYIRAFYVDDATFHQTHVGATFDGPIFTVPGGEVRAAVGSDFRKDNYFYALTANDGARPTTAFITTSPDPLKRTVFAVFGQVNIPVVGEMNAMPMARRLSVELSYRYDHYSDSGNATNPKVAVDWEPIADLTLRGSWGTSFAAPSFANLSYVASKTVQQQNIAAGATTNALPACLTVGGTPEPGSVAAILNPACSAALQFPGGLNQNAGYLPIVGITRPANYKLGPEKATNYTLGFSYAPAEGFLSGLFLDFTYYHTKIKDILASAPADLNRADLRFAYVVRGDANFDAALAQYLSSPVAPAVPNPANIQWLFDGMVRNLGSETQSGVDFVARHDWELDGFGIFKTGFVGNYLIKNPVVALAGSPASDPTIGDNTNAGIGNATVPRLKYRAELGWDSGDGITASVFINYVAHYFHTQAKPPAASLSAFPDYTNWLPEVYTFDASLGYDFADRPANDYLKNINIQLVVNNIFDRRPPFVYRVQTSGGASTYDGQFWSPIGRVVSLSITKVW